MGHGADVVLWVWTHETQSGYIPGSSRMGDESNNIIRELSATNVPIAMEIRSRARGTQVMG